MDVTLHTKLRVAANRCYQVVADGPVPTDDDDKAYPDFNYIAQPKGFVATIERKLGDADYRDAATIGVTSDHIVLAFRGTLPPTQVDNAAMVSDWFNDGDIELVPWPGGNRVKVHKGFKSTIEDLWPKLSVGLNAAIAANPGRRLLVTGHSKGGPVANLAAMRLREEHAGLEISVCTFAGARPGNTKFAAAYARALPDSVRYEYRNDIVPHLPPTRLGLDLLGPLGWLLGEVDVGGIGDYASVGALRYIDKRGARYSIEPESTVLEFERVARMLADIPSIPGDHAIKAGSGYADGVLQASGMTQP